MRSYFARHTDELDIDDATRQRLWAERIFAIHFPENGEGVIGHVDNESTDPADYPAGTIARYIEILNEISREGGYVLAEYHGHSEYLAGRVDAGTPVEIIRGIWGRLNDAPAGRPAVLKGFHLRNHRLVPREEIAGLLALRPPRGTLHRWRKAGNAVGRLVDGDNAESSEVNQHQRAFLVWDELIAYARARRPVFYGTLGKLTGMHHRVLRYPLELIEVFCDENGLPPLSILVVDQNSKRPREGFKAWNISNFEEGAEKVYDFDWVSYGNPFTFAANGTRTEEIELQLVAEPAKAQDIYAVVKVRGAVQMLFRGALLRVYGGACALSGSTLEEGLEAAHIVSWRDASLNERLSVRNGVILTSWYHRLFDRGMLTISEDYRVRVCPRVWKSASEYDWFRLQEIEGRPLRLPEAAEHHPDPELIRRRNEALDWYNILA